MIFEFIIAYRRHAKTQISPMIIDALKTVLEDYVGAMSIEDVAWLIQFKHERLGAESTDENGESFHHTVLGFSANLPDDSGQLRSIVDDFVATLSEVSPIYHVVKFEDHELCNELRNYGDEIFALEMKVRRVLTLIYLHAYTEPYNLLRDDDVQPMSKERLAHAQMKNSAENQFFHLTFSQYIRLNTRHEIKLHDVISAVRDAASFELFRDELSRAPIMHEDDADLIVGLRERMNAIEAMRNCVAHNRRPPQRMIADYNNARPLLEEILDSYLSRGDIAYPASEESPSAETPGDDAPPPG